MNTAIASNGDTRIFFQDSGGAGVPVVLGHGFFLDSSLFAPQIDALEDVARVIAWDARGHGNTITSAADWTFWDQAADVVAVLDALEIQRAVIGGVSQGGFTALRCALQSPERVAGLVLIDTEAGPCRPEDAQAYPHLFDQWNTGGPIPELARPLAAQLVGDTPSAGLWLRRWEQRYREGRRIGQEASCLLHRDSVVDRLTEIQVPALLIRGSNDNAIPAEEMATLAKGLPAADGVHTIDGGAHAVTASHPSEVNHLIRSFLRQLPVELRGRAATEHGGQASDTPESRG